MLSVAVAEKYCCRYYGVYVEDYFLLLHRCYIFMSAKVSVVNIGGD